MLPLSNSADATFQEHSQVCNYCEEANLNYYHFYCFYKTTTVIYHFYFILPSCSLGFVLQ